MGKFIEITGNKYGRLLVLCRLARRTNKNGCKWLCICECGKVKIAMGTGLRAGHNRSCGCLFRLGPRTTHGMTNSKLYDVFYNIKRRVFDKEGKDYRSYGGRGILLCKEWDASFTSFANWALSHGYEEGLEIDRKNNDGPYSPDNCHFISSLQNNHNKRNLMRTNKSGYSGVWFDKKLHMYVSSIGWSISKGKYKRATLGRFSSPEAAVTVRNAFIIKHNLPHRIQEITK